MGDSTGNQVSPNEIQTLLSGVDLRGLGPEELSVLMKGGLGMRELMARDAASVQRAQQDQIENYYRHYSAMIAAGKDHRDAQKFALEMSQLNRSTPYEVNGQMMIDWTTPQGQVAKREIVGPATPKTEGVRWMQAPDGRVFKATASTPDSEIPKGSIMLSNVHPKDGQLTVNDQTKLAMMKGIVESGQTVSDTGATLKYDEPTRDSIMQVVNQSDPHNQFVKIPGREVPGIGNDIPTQYIKLPKTAIGILAMPDTQVIAYDDKTGKSLTVTGVKQFAKDKGVAPELVLKHFGLIK